MVWVGALESQIREGYPYSTVPQTTKEALGD